MRKFNQEFIECIIGKSGLQITGPEDFDIEWTEGNNYRDDWYTHMESIFKADGSYSAEGIIRQYNENEFAVDPEEYCFKNVVIDFFDFLWKPDLFSEKKSDLIGFSKIKNNLISDINHRINSLGEFYIIYKLTEDLKEMQSLYVESISKDYKQIAEQLCMQLIDAVKYQYSQRINLAIDTLTRFNLAKTGTIKKVFNEGIAEEISKLSFEFLKPLNDCFKPGKEKLSAHQALFNLIKNENPSGFYFEVEAKSIHSLYKFFYFLQKYIDVKIQAKSIDHFHFETTPLSAKRYATWKSTNKASLKEQDLPQLKNIFYPS